MTKKFNIITIGGATRDIIFYTADGEIVNNKKDLTREKLVCFESGAKVNIKEAYFSIGGGACNTAVSFARLGLKASALIRVGRDREGDKVAADLKMEGVDISLIEQDKKESTGFSFIVVSGKTKEHTAFLFRGANDNLQLARYKLEDLNTDWIYLSSLSGKDWLPVLKTAASRVLESKFPPGGWQKKQGIKFAWNPGLLQLQAGKDGLENFLQIVDVLVLNKDEALELVISGMQGSKTVSVLKRVEYLLKTIYSWGVGLVVITCGAEGAYIYDGDNVFFRKAPKVKRADTTGAGDSFGSSFVAGLILFDDIDKALELAIVNSTSVVTKIGAQAGLLTLREIEK